MCVLQKLPVIAIRYDKKILDTNQCCEISSTWLDIAAPSIISQIGEQNTLTNFAVSTVFLPRHMNSLVAVLSTL